MYPAAWGAELEVARMMHWWCLLLHTNSARGAITGDGLLGIGMGSLFASDDVVQPSTAGNVDARHSVCLSK